MVAISLYRGNLHKVPKLPRRWLCPIPNISLKDFRTLLHRRDRALSRLRSSNPSPVRTPKSDSNNAHTDPIPVGIALNNGKNNDCGNHVGNDCSGTELPPKGVSKEGEAEEGKVKKERLVGGEDSLKKSMETIDALVEEENDEGNVKNRVKEEVPVNPVVVEKNNTENGASDVQKRKKEIEEKLEVLNERKHSLVQVLKQILNAEEQLKRQNTVQGIPGRPPLPLQVDTTTDSGSVTRLNTPKTGSDGNPSGDMEGGEADDVSNHNIHSHHLPHTSLTSPSSDTQQRKPASNTAPPPHRAMLGVAGSPSRFAPAGQGHSSISVSGASYIASSPSPAASGGTSIFRDGRLPSPWN